MVMRHQSSHRRVGSGPNIGLRKAHSERRTIRIAGERHATAQRHDLDIGSFELAVRAGLAERGDGSQYHARIDAAQRSITEFKTLQIAGGETFNDEIGFGRKPRKDFAAFCRLQIERNAALIIIEAEPVETFLGIGLVPVERPKSPRGVASGPFDLNDVGAQIAEYFAAQKAEFVRQIKNSKGRKQSFALVRIHRDFKKKGRAPGPALF